MSGDIKLSFTQKRAAVKHIALNKVVSALESVYWDYIDSHLKSKDN